MNIPLEGKTILITGASCGIGEATARACTKAGMHCVITARRTKRLQALASDLGSTCTYISGDVTEEGFNTKLLEEAGNIYALFANAGYGLDQKMINLDEQQFRSLFNTNVFAPIELASLVAKNMVKNKTGHILFCASCLSKFATPSHGAYCASKSALEAVAKSMRMELKGDKIFVSTVHPIGTRTEFFDTSAIRSGKTQSDFESQTPSWLMQHPDKVANAIVRCLRRPKPEVWTSIPIRLISTSFSAFPRLSEVITQSFS